METGLAEQIIAAIQQVGFPIFVAVFMLTEMRKATKENTAVLIELRSVIQKLCDKMKGEN